MANKRGDFASKTVRSTVNNYEKVFVEDLWAAYMKRNRRFQVK